jgi:acyl-CoA synthetase (AMP-forming)/AMP-acid ligase II
MSASYPLVDNSPPVDLPGAIDWSGHYRRLAARYRSLVAASDADGRALTYADLVERAHGLATLLQDRGLGPGAPVASLLPNSLEAVWVSLAIKIGGFAEVALGWGYTAEEIAWSAQLSGAQILITQSDRSTLADKLGLEPIAIEALRLPSGAASLRAVPGSTRGRIQFTSGTTGRPKGVLTTHYRRWVGEQVQKANLPFIPRPGSRILLMTPYVHGAGILSQAWFDCGGEIILHAGVDPDRVLPLIEARNIEAMFAPPTVLAKLITAFGERQLPGLRCIFTGTQPLALGLYERARAMFGPIVRITYGKTECINPITTLAFDEIDEAFAESARAGASCTGWPAPGVELRIGAPQTGATVDEGEDEGEVWLRAPQLSEGLITQDGFAPHEPDGWHATGDLGFIDQRGRLWLTGRVADVIKTGGYRVNPDEIEATLAGMHSCSQVCIFSLSSEYWGEIIVAAAEKPGTGWRAELDSRLETLSRHKRPRLAIELEALPRNPQGKISRRKLRDHVLDHYRLIDGPYPAIKPIT